MYQQPYPGYQQYQQAPPAITCPRCSAPRADGVTCSVCGLLAGFTGQSWQLASAGRRFAGALLFSAVPFVAAMAAVFVLVAMLSSNDAYYQDEFTTGMFWAMTVTFMAPFVAYWVWWFMLAPEGQSPIKRMLGMRVVTASGAPAGVGPMLLRSLVGQHIITWIVPFYGLVNTLWLLWDKDRQCLHDKIASTYVVLAEPVFVESGSQRPQPYGFAGQQRYDGQPGRSYGQPSYGQRGYDSQPVLGQPAPQQNPQTWAAPAYAAPQSASETQASRFCRTCGNGLLADARFCAVCGTPVS